MRGTFSDIRAPIHTNQNIPAVSLITVQNVFPNVKKDQRIEQLKDWADFLKPGGKLIVEVPHPNKHCGAILGLGSGLAARGRKRASPLKSMI